MSQTPNPFSQQLVKRNPLQYACYLFLALECNVPVVQACLHFQLVECYDKKALRKSIETYLAFRLRERWIFLKHLQNSGDWKHRNGTSIRCYWNDDYVTIYCFRNVDGFWQRINIKNSFGTSPALFTTDNAATGAHLEISIFVGSFFRQIELAVDELILICEKRLPLLVPRLFVDMGYPITGAHRMEKLFATPF